jgi:proteic killer suppression protein
MAAAKVWLYRVPVTLYVTPVIRTFRDRRTQAVFANRLPKGFPPSLALTARRKLRALDASVHLDDLKVPPGNRLEALRGDRAGQHSIRVNDQWRVCFVWRDDDAYEVEIVDYH